jgi:DNA-binding Lrp family transcriptional regulator
VLEIWNTQGPLNQNVLGEKLGLSRNGAVFIFSKLKKEGKL